MFNNNINFLALDLAYVRPRVPEDIRQQVLARNDGLCVVCNSVEATEVDHIKGGSIALDNLRGLCRRCHELKPRGPIPIDLTREGKGIVDASTEASTLLDAWRAALFLGEPLGEGGDWYDLETRALACQDTRFGWITCQILAEHPISPAHDERNWKNIWQKMRRDYLAWAKRELAH
ncbi:HNH endonuclease [Actinomyces sp. Z3]|uniref:HNH endonuclease n=1 Tax=unclassified Actinomyces TaxID=2609248 RepID=UPI0037BFBFD1